MTQELEANKDLQRQRDDTEMQRGREMETETAAEAGEAEARRVASRECWWQVPLKTSVGSASGIVPAQNIFHRVHKLWRNSFLAPLC